jgi:hypothetical protein
MALGSENPLIYAAHCDLFWRPICPTAMSWNDSEAEQTVLSAVRLLCRMNNDLGVEYLQRQKFSNEMILGLIRMLQSATGT